MLENLRQDAQRRKFPMADLFQCCIGFGIGQGGNELLGGSCGSVDGNYSGDLGVLWVKLYCVRVALVPGVGPIDAITAIMVH